MTDNHMNLFCLVDGEATSTAFSVKIPSNDTVDDLKNLIKTALSPQFDDIAAKDITLWRVDQPVIAANKHNPILLSAIEFPTELDPTDDISDVFEHHPPKKTIHIIVQLPSQSRSGNVLIHQLLNHGLCRRNVLISFSPHLRHVDNLHPEVAALRKQLSNMEQLHAELLDPSIST